MNIHVKCPNCSYPATVGPQKAGTRKTCDKCGKMFKIPDLESLEDAISILNISGGNIYVDQKGKIYG
jgi:transposase-like protein